MKTINYTGSSKLISRIVNLLNRRAPLPLDGDGDPDWGTNGQVLSTDGSGNTAWVNQGGGGSGGHTIWNRIKSALTQRGKLWFADASVSDVSADDATKVEVVTELLNETAFDNLATDGTADGIYTFPDSGGEYLTAAMSSYDNTVSGLSATNAQDAIDGVATLSAKQTITLNSGFEAVSLYGGCFYRKRNTTVEVNLSFGGALNTDWVTIGTLPSGYRPTFRAVGSAVGFNGSGIAVAMFYVQPDGQIVIKSSYNWFYGRLYFETV